MPRPARTSGEVLASVIDLHCRYGRDVAVAGVSFSVRQARVLGLLGPNGAGKTTTLDCLCGVRRPQAGHVEIEGQDVFSAGAAARARIGYLPERPPLYPELRVSEYLRFCYELRAGAPGSRAAPASAREADDRNRTGPCLGSRADAVRRVIDRCHLGEVSERRVGTLSKGYQQRLGLAQALIHDPALIVLDEPTVGLDPNQLQHFRALVRELATSHAVVLSTHILSEVEAVCDDVVVLDRGKVVLDCALEQLGQGAGSESRPAGLLVRWERAPTAKALLALPGVMAVDEIDPERRFVRGASIDELTDTLVEASVAHAWRLREMVRERAALESVFVSLTRGDADPTRGATGEHQEPAPDIAPAPTRYGADSQSPLGPDQGEPTA